MRVGRPYAAGDKIEESMRKQTAGRRDSPRPRRPMNTLFQRHVLSRLWLTFVVLGLSFLAFGAGTLNLGLLLMANARLLGDYGWQAIGDGALRQLLELAASGYFSMAAYVVFKTCEHRLSHWLGHEGASATPELRSGPAVASLYDRVGGIKDAVMKTDYRLALEAIDAALPRAASPVEGLTAACRILQRLPGYTGVYLYALEGDELVLKAFHGRATDHTRIPVGRGICGASVQSRAPVVVAEVASDPRYLACNIETKSEIVFPIFRGEIYLAQIDVDSDESASFGADDEAFLAQVAERLEPLF